ncbi:CPBP family intramembrane glutamic endopeptidase [Actinoplanes derwentensis]|uniref:Membrane protease YdiL, CAAX protease family n=1 Tax=Actinoplanes derwentensis TaxID=113562 RepID=A0A1H1TUR3_9ACTN|nr:CPBP family intramembrane glutamic endopeptidase [Actinoplanes derwentensis]GID85142.1 CAAX amino protease [Actinoplanes derwentensis]SDS63938.1 Membrane protease YdiL, CAAX protease family [Actinoplanes derwentensis]
MSTTGTPYHRLALTPTHRWWRPLLGTFFILATGVVAFLVTFFVYAGAAELTGQPDGADGMPTFGPLAELALGFVSLAVLLPVVLLAARLTQARPAGTLSSVDGRIRWRWLMICLPVAAVAIIVFMTGGTALAVLTGEESGLDVPLVGWAPFLTSTAVLFLVVPFQAAAEEYLCRGWLLQAVGTWFRGPWVPIVFQALVFAALHGWGTPFGFFDLAVFGVIAGWVTVRTGGLEAAIALHVMNNLLSSIVAGAFGQLTIDETAADMPWQMAAADLPVLLGFAAVITWLWRRRPAPMDSRELVGSVH